MSAPKVGDKVRYTLGDNTIVGEVVDPAIKIRPKFRTPTLMVRMSDGWTLEIPKDWTVEVIEPAKPPMPDEPEALSVVRDRYGDLWVRSRVRSFSSAWGCLTTSLNPDRYAWSDLWHDSGPLTPAVLPGTVVTWEQLQDLPDNARLISEDGVLVAHAVNLRDDRQTFTDKAPWRLIWTPGDAS